MRLIYFAFLTFTFIISSCFFTTLYAQNISQLESQLQQASEIEKANIQLQLGHLHLNRDPERSISLANKVLKFGVTTNNYELQANARLIIAHASFKKKEYEKAYINTEKADNYLKNQKSENYYINKELQGNISFELGKFKTSIKQLKETYSFYNKKNDSKNSGFVASKIGSAYEELTNYNSAIIWHKKALSHFKKSKNIREIILTKSILGGVYGNYGNYSIAKKTLIEALNLAKKNNYDKEVIKLNERIRIISKNIDEDKLSTTEFEKKQVKEQKELLSKFSNQRTKSLEEIEKLNKKNQLIELKIRVQQDEYEKKLLSEQMSKLMIEEALKQEQLEKQNLKLALENERLLSEKKSVENQRLFISLTSLILVVILILLALIIKSRSNRKLAQKNREIKLQKAEIEKKQEHINQSIMYATKIQEAILPSSYKLLNNFNGAFIYLNPKDQVSGDFVWVHQGKNKVFLCVADCTGHGVPGAFMSIIFNNILDEIIKKEKIEDPHKILERSASLLSEKVKEQGQNLSKFKDGMDAAFITIDLENSKAYFSGAKNSLYLIRNQELNEFKGSKYSIDTTLKQISDSTKFSDTEIELIKSDQLYLFTDGFMDQKGGDKNTKFYRKNFKEFILSNSKFSMKEQKKQIETKFEEWKGANEQIDDCLIVGIKI
ncbi:hypothetical protein CW751_14690 [Brumimicrobium salinarum]|uniref:PPM-type phosphatase domain-containing protein n=1 Tax=Brumimicrobium salinarum TaxID=2058658 RepID=A0A2I0QYW3_9FLAO|nr:SpoIIE family protein phosphatase [Brumimicrobium salinarum]PKR79511.1 hypothetical protein CW751_14690 [Brumimicrobium salinarum]